MVKTTYTCDNKQCGKTKGESNHWIGIHLLSTCSTLLPRFEVRGFEDRGPDDEHYCSPGCINKRFNELLDELRAASIKSAENRAADNEEGDAIDERAGISGASA